MKKIKILFAALAMLSITSCKDYLDVEPTEFREMLKPLFKLQQMPR